MAAPVVLTKSLVAASANNICLSQNGVAGVAMTLNGSTGGVLDSQRRVRITSGSDDRLVNFTVIGTDDTGNKVVSVIAGSNSSTADTPNDFRTVTSVTPSGATTATTVGTNTTGSTPWQMFNRHVTPPHLGLEYTLVSGAQTSSVEYTDDEFMGGIGVQDPAASSPNPRAILHPQMQAMVGNADGKIDWTIRGWRWTITAGAGNGTLTGIQAGLWQ
jgi:hypothetical protein